VDAANNVVKLQAPVGASGTEKVYVTMPMAVYNDISLVDKTYTGCTPNAYVNPISSTCTHDVAAAVPTTTCIYDLTTATPSISFNTASVAITADGFTVLTEKERTLEEFANAAVGATTDAFLFSSADNYSGSQTTPYDITFFGLNPNQIGLQSTVTVTASNAADWTTLAFGNTVKINGVAKTL